MGHRGVVVVVFLLCATWGTAQVTVGDNLHMTMNGSAGVGYSGGFGNFSRSSHGLGFGFDGLMNGYYFDPRFINFDVRPYFDRTQANSDTQNVLRGSGIGGSAGFFSNTIYPGSVSIGTDYSANSEYQFAGVPSLATNTSSRSFGITWSLLLPNKPTLTANFGVGTSDSNVIGTTMNSASSNRNLTLTSTYIWHGWNTQGGFSHYNFNFNTPEFITGTPEQFGGRSTNYSFTTDHKIPINGNFSFGWSHTSGESLEGDQSSGTSYSASAGITPWQRLALGSSFTYSTSAAQTLANSILGPEAGTVNLYSNNVKLLFNYNSASIYLGRGFTAIAHMAWRELDYGYASYTDTQYGGTISYRYNKRWLQGFYFNTGMVDTANKTGNGGAGLTATVGMDRRFGHWETSADFNYLHDVQTLYNFVNTSYLNWGGNARRKLNPQTYLMFFYRSSHSGLEAQSGSGNMATNAGGAFNWKGYGLTANYSMSRGTAVLANGILVSTPEGPLFTPDYLYFNAKALSFSAAKHFRFRLSVSAAYSKVESSSSRTDFLNTSSGDRFSASTSYVFRKLSFQGGFARVNQQYNFTPSNGQTFQPQIVDSYFVSVSRFFNIF